MVKEKCGQKRIMILNIKHLLVLINWSAWYAVLELHAPYNLIMIFFSSINFTWMGCQMRIHETNERFIQLHTNTYTAFVTLHFDSKKRNEKKRKPFQWNAYSARILFVFLQKLALKSIYSKMTQKHDTIKLSAPVPTACVEYRSTFLRNSCRTITVNIMPTKRTDTNSS